MYRMERAFEMLIAAEDNLKIEQYNSSFTLVAKNSSPREKATNIGGLLFGGASPLALFN